MEKKVFYHIAQWVFGLLACGYLVYELIVFDDYAALGESLRSMGVQQWIAIAVCIALMPVNMSLEAWRWKTLMPMSWRDAHRQVYYSKLAGLVTPWRLGEYPARGLLMDQNRENLWPKVLSMGAVGSATMTAAIVLAGVLGLAFSPAVLAYLGGSYLYALAAVVLVLALAFFLMPKALKQWAEVNTDLLLRSLGQSLVRLACWCVQLGLVLSALNHGQSLGFIADTMLMTPVYYLLVTVTPNVPIAEAGVRGAWAMMVFGSMNAALAGVLLWGINTLLPCIIWPFMRKK